MAGGMKHFQGQAAEIQALPLLQKQVRRIGGRQPHGFSGSGPDQGVLKKGVIRPMDAIGNIPVFFELIWRKQGIGMAMGHDQGHRNQLLFVQKGRQGPRAVSRINDNGLAGVAAQAKK